MISDISVVVCTHNRADILQQTLDSFSEMAAGCAARHELLIIDNGSSDRTPTICADFVIRHSGTRHLVEPVPGLSLARNLGLREAKSEIVAFADDDVYFEPGWLDAIVAAFRDHPDADCIGGHTTPHFETAPPDWMESAQKRMYGSTEFGDQSRWMVHPEVPFGVNMAFRRKALVEIGGFDPRLGRIGENLLSCEEILLFQQMHDVGRRCWYCAEARLLHRIPADRTTPEWLIRRMYWQGVSESVLEQVRSPKGPAKLWGEALLWAGRWIVRSITRLASPRHLLGRDRNRDLHARARQARFRGRLRQSVNEALGR